MSLGKGGKGGDCCPAGDLRLDESLAAAMGGRTYCKSEELTREALLAWAVASGAAVPVALARVTVQRADGARFEVAVEDGEGCVMDVKREVEKVEGVSASLCDLFLLSEGSGSGDEGDREGEGSTSDSGSPLCDDAKVEDGWLLALIVRGTRQQQ